MEERQKTGVVIPALLFAVTALTTTASGAMMEGVNPLKDPSGLASGIPFSLALLLILGTHEFGHYFASRRNGVPTTLPNFVPGPPLPPLPGTFGAIIKIKAPIATKRALVEIGSAGPLTGFVVAVIVTIIGLRLSWFVPIFPTHSAMMLGDCLLLKFLSYVVMGPVPPGQAVYLHPVLFAGWFGLFVTSINLIPVGQLDGGHIAYAIAGARNHRRISMVAALAMLILGIFAWNGWVFWAVLVTIIGLRHPPTSDPHVQLDPWSKRLSAASIVVFILTFTPMPFYII